MNKLKDYKYIVKWKKKMTSSLDTGCRVGGITYPMVCYGLLCGMFCGHLYATIGLEDEVVID